MIVIDCGLMFPEEEMLGIDLVIPDITYVEENRDRVRGDLHHPRPRGPHRRPALRPATSSTCADLRHAAHPRADRRQAQGASPAATRRDPARSSPARRSDLGAFRVEFFQRRHSIPDAVGLAIKTPVGTIVHTGDFKLDQTPVDGQLTDLARLAELGQRGRAAAAGRLRTYAEVPGYTPSERVVGEALDRIIRPRRRAA